MKQVDVLLLLQEKEKTAKGSQFSGIFRIFALFSLIENSVLVRLPQAEKQEEGMSRKPLEPGGLHPMGRFGKYRS